MVIAEDGTGSSAQATLTISVIPRPIRVVVVDEGMKIIKYCRGVRDNERDSQGCNYSLRR